MGQFAANMALIRPICFHSSDGNGDTPVNGRTSWSSHGAIVVNVQCCEEKCLRECNLNVLAGNRLGLFTVLVHPIGASGQASHNDRLQRGERTLARWCGARVDSALPQ